MLRVLTLAVVLTCSSTARLIVQWVTIRSLAVGVTTRGPLRHLASRRLLTWLGLVAIGRLLEGRTLATGRWHS